MSSTTCPVPRAASSEPRPVARGNVCVCSAVGVRFASFRFSTPLPWATGSATGSGEAVSMSSFFTWSGVAEGCCCKISAAAPDTAAAACDVPLPRKNRVPTRPVGCSWSE